MGAQRNRGLAFIWSEPLAALKLFGTKAVLLVLAPEIPNNLNLYFYRHYSAVLRWPLPGASLVLPLGLTAVALALARGRGRSLALPLAYLGAYSASVVLFFTCARFRLPLIPVLIILGADLAVELHDRLRSGSWRAVAGPATALALVAAAVNAPWLWHDAHRPERDLASNVTAANAWLKCGRPDLAVASWRTALAIGTARPDPVFLRRLPSFHEVLGVTLLELGRPDEARPHLLAALRLAPGETPAAEAALKRLDAPPLEP